jgi:secreted Zn-dependent insulinase-like peptidase
VPNNMILVIYGSKSFNFYEKLIHKTFGNLKPKNINYLTEVNQPFPYFSTPSFTFYESLKDSKQLEINFPLPNIFETGHLFLKFILTQKVKGSLWSVLKNKNYILKINCLKKRIYSNHNLFKISFILTEHGSENIQDLLNILQSYLDYFAEEIIFQDKLYSKIKSYYNNQFYNGTLHNNKKIKNKNVKNIFSFLQIISENVKDFPDEQIISAYKVMNDYITEKENLKLFSQHLSLNNSIILYGMKNFENLEIFKGFGLFLENFDPELILKKNEKWLNTNYGTYSINYKNLLVNKRYNFSFEEYFHSPLLKKSKSLNKICKSKKCLKHANKDEKNLSPMKIISDDNGELWYKVRLF